MKERDLAEAFHQIRLRAKVEQQKVERTEPVDVEGMKRTLQWLGHDPADAERYAAMDQRRIEHALNQ